MHKQMEKNEVFAYFLCPVPQLPCGPIQNGAMTLLARMYSLEWCSYIRLILIVAGDIDVR